MSLSVDKMFSFFTLVYLCAFFLLLSSYVKTTGWFYKGLPEQLRTDSLSLSSHNLLQTRNPIRENYFPQVLDHFNPIIYSISEKWQQRYFFNSFATSQDSNAPIFVYIGGEGPLLEEVVQIGMVPEMAQNFGAELYALEHRFYGKSHPKNDSRVEYLQWLTSNQALADLTEFVDSKLLERKKKFNLKHKKIPVIVFGCSYPGALAAYARTKYPTQITGAIASSAPVEAKENFTQYDSFVQKVLPEKCKKMIEISQKVIEKTIFQAYENSHADLKRILTKFGCSELAIENKDDLIDFLFILADAIATAVQYNSPEKNLIDYVCHAFETIEETPKHDPKGYDGKVINTFASVVRHVLKVFGSNCNQEAMRQNTNTTLGTQEASSRLWSWQCCTEYGYWQTGYNGSLRSELIDVDWNLRACNHIFPLAQGHTFKSDVASQSNKWTGGWHLSDIDAATNIHFTNGQRDPWSTLSIKKVGFFENIKQKINSYVIESASHCRDFGASLSKDSTSLKQSRIEIKKAIQSWLDDFYSGDIPFTNEL